MCSKNPFCSIYVDNQTGCFIGDSAFVKSAKVEM